MSPVRVEFASDVTIPNVIYELIRRVRDTHRTHRAIMGPLEFEVSPGDLNQSEHAFNIITARVAAVMASREYATAKRTWERRISARTNMRRLLDTARGGIDWAGVFDTNKDPNELNRVVAHYLWLEICFEIWEQSNAQELDPDSQGRLLELLAASQTAADPVAALADAARAVNMEANLSRIIAEVNNRIIQAGRRALR